MKLVVTIDTEEDNWNRYSINDNPVNNIKEIVKLQTLFNEFDVKPTYLISYPVATNPSAVKILKKILDEGRCEIGAHCHPWNTPPFSSDKEITKKSTMLCNLSDEVIFDKISTLHHTITEKFGVAPVSFRSGRWALSAGVIRALTQLNYRIDTSATPFTSWQAYHGGSNFMNIGPEPFNISFDDSFVATEENSPLLEVPVSIGYLQKDFRKALWLENKLARSFSRKCHLPGFFERVGLLNQIRLSPEQFELDAMKKLIENLKDRGLPCLNITFHSTCLLPGACPFVRTKEDKEFFLGKIRSILEYMRELNFTSVTLREFHDEANLPFRKKSLIENNNFLFQDKNNERENSQFSLKCFVPSVVKRHIKWIAKNIFQSLSHCVSGSSSPDLTTTKSVFFICQGNVCRSAFAHHYFKQIASSRFNVDSCGLFVDKQGPSPAEAIAVAKELGVDLKPHISKDLTAVDLNSFDLIVVMEYDHFLKLKELYPHKNIRLLRIFCRWPQRVFCNIYDPYGLALMEFKRCFRLVKLSLDNLNESLLEIN